MKKIALAAAIASFTATSAFAGNVNVEATDTPIMVEPEASMGSGSSTWIIPRSCGQQPQLI